MIENSDAVRVRPSSLFHFVSPFFWLRTSRPTSFFSFKLCAHRSFGPRGAVSLSVLLSLPPPSLSVVFPSPPLAPQRQRRRRSISIDLKFSKPISCTRLPLTFEPEEGELRREKSRFSKGLLNPCDYRLFSIVYLHILLLSREYSP